METQDALRSAYMVKAQEAFDAADYKASMIYMRQVSLTDRESITLFVDSAYCMWRSLPSGEAEVQASGRNSQLLGEDEAVRSRKEALDSVKHAFTELLSQKSTSSLVTAYEYIRLSHIYLSEGALLGALQILQLASARGHLENTLVVLQSLTILTKLRQTKQAEQHITFLITDITLEDRSNTGRIGARDNDVIMVQNSSLPMHFVYLHCACYLKRRAQLTLDADQIKENMELCMHMLAEAHFIHFARRPADYAELTAWFNSSELFFDMAVVLEATPFVLLAEDSFWEAFLRAQLSDKALSRMLACMRLTKRGRREYLWERLEQAYRVNRWNSFCRRELLAIEALECAQSKARIAVYAARFDDENFIAGVVQGIVRGFLLRKVHWPAVYRRAKKKRDEWLDKVEKADRAHNKAFKRRRKELVARWRANARVLHLLRKAASTRVQTCWRRKAGQLGLVRRFARADRANSLFLGLCQRSYDLCRVRTLRLWEKTYQLARLHRASTCIARTLLANGYSAQLNKSVSRILGVIRVLRRNSNREIFPHWRERFLIRRKKHARVTIRSFIRAQLTRRKEQDKEAAMQSKVEIVRVMMSKSTSHVLPLKREMWARWREEQQKKRVVKARLYVALALPRVLARQKARKVVHRLRVRHEIHSSFAMQSLFRRVGRSLVFWQRITAMQRMQRMWRQTLARRAYRRQKNIVATMARWQHRRWLRAYRTNWFRWGKFIYLRMRSRHRMARRVTVFFQKIVRNRRVIRATRRKPRAFVLLMTFHTIMLTRAFRKMAAGVTGLHTLMVLGPLFLSRWRQCVRLGFSMWVRKHINQGRMLALLRILGTRRLDRRFWVGAGDSVAVTPRLSLSLEEFRYRQMLPKAALVLSWERVVRPTEVRYKNQAFLVMHRAFRTMMATYRYRHRLKMSVDNDAGAYSTAEREVNEDIRCMFKRARDVIRLQCAWRIYAAKKARRRAYMLRLRTNEIILRVENKPRWRLFDWMVRRAERLREARGQLQCFYRQWKARKTSSIRRDYLALLAACVVTVNRNSKSARALLAKHLKKMVILYIYSVAGMHTDEALLRSVESVKRRILRALVGPRDDSAFSSSTSVQSRRKGQLNRPLRGRVPATKSPARSLDEFSLVSNTANRRGSGAAEIASHGAVNALAARKIASMQTHQSADFHTQVYRLRQTCIFVFEANGGLSVVETEYLLQAAQSVFCQNVASPALQQIYTHYRGGKLVLCGGRVTLHDMLGLLHFCGARTMQLSLHFSDCPVSFSAALAMLLCLGPTPSAPHAAALLEALCMLSSGARMDGDDDSEASLGSGSRTQLGRLSATTRRLLQSQYEPLREANTILPSIDMPMSLQLLPSPPPRLTCLSCLRELSVDTNSLGALGVAVALTNMKDNSSIEVLITTLSRNAVLPSLGKCLRAMAPNGSLREFRLFGQPLGSFEVQGLLEAVTGGLRGLRHLEFSVVAGDAEAEAGAERIVNLAKQRLHAGRLSLSVSVN